MAINLNGTGSITGLTSISSPTISGGNLPAGDATNPGLTFSGDTNTGIYSPGADQLAISTNGSGRLFVDSNGNVEISGTGKRIRGDFSNATHANRLSFQTSTIDGATTPFILPNGTGTSAGLVATNSSDPTNAGFIQLRSTSTTSDIISSKLGSGTVQPLFLTTAGAADIVLQTNSSERLRVTSAGLVGIGTTSPSAKLEIYDGDVYITGPNDGTAKTLQFRWLETVIPAADSTIGGIEFYSADSSNPGVSSAIYGYGDAINQGSLIFQTGVGGGATERARIDSSGRLLVGTSSARAGSNFKDAGYTALTQVESAADNQSYGGSFVANSGTTNSTVRGCVLTLGRTRGTSVNSNTSVASGDLIGRVQFSGADGTNLVSAASIQGFVDGTPGTDDMPGRLVFSVTADGSASPSEAMRINNAGELLVGYTSDNGAYKLQVNSQIFATSATIATSDGRYKENVAALDGCVDLVKALRPVSFDWKTQEPVTRMDEDGETVVVREAHNFPDGKQVGFIAQEVEEVLADKPWLGSVIKQNVRPAVTDADGNELAPEEEFLGIAEGNLVAVLTSALKDAIGEIESLKARVAALETP